MLDNYAVPDNGLLTDADRAALADLVARLKGGAETLPGFLESLVGSTGGTSADLLRSMALTNEIATIIGLAEIGSDDVRMALIRGAQANAFLAARLAE